MSKRLTVELEVMPGRSDDFEAFMAGATARVRAEDSGCEQYHLFRSLDHQSRYVLVESWATAEDLEAHRSSEAMAQMGGMRDFLVGSPVLHRYED